MKKATNKNLKKQPTSGNSLNYEYVKFGVHSKGVTSTLDTSLYFSLT